MRQESMGLKFWTYQYKKGSFWDGVLLLRDGVLLRGHFPDFGVGYSDLSPLPEFGEAPTSDHLKSLHNSEPTPLMERAIQMAKRDAKARSLGRSLFEGLNPVRNHYLIQNFENFEGEDLKRIQSCGFLTLKVKINRGHQKKAWSWIDKVVVDHGFQIRLDLNSQGSFSWFEEGFKSLSEDARRAIEYVEDPLPYEGSVWTRLQEFFPLAIDWEWKNFLKSEFGGRVPFGVVVLKPSRQDPGSIVDFCQTQGLGLVVTHSMDHPLGALQALSLAMELSHHRLSVSIEGGLESSPPQVSLLDSGCLCPYYVENPFGPWRKEGVFALEGELCEGARGRLGTGVGWDQELELLNWEALGERQKEPRVKTKVDSSEVRLSPRLTAKEVLQLHRLVETCHKEYPNILNEEEHVWVASSGSSQRPGDSLKVYALSKSGLRLSAQAVNQVLGISNSGHQEDIWGLVLPTFHVGGLGIIYRSWVSGVPYMTWPSEGDGEKQTPWDPLLFLSWVRRHRITLVSLVPTQVYDLVTQGGGIKSPSSLRAVIVGGGSLAPAIYWRALSLGWPLRLSYGLTECSSQVATGPCPQFQSIRVSPEDPIASPLPPLEILSHVEVEMSPEGYIRIRSPSLFRISAQFCGGVEKIDIHPKGEYYTTPDRGYREGSWLFPSGRGEDFVKILGEGVSIPLLRHRLDLLFGGDPGQTLLVCPEDRRGQDLVLLVESQIWGPQLRDRVAAFQKASLPFERLRQLWVTEKILRTDLGKVLGWEKQRSGVLWIQDLSSHC